MICPNCGQVASLEAKFCQSCGKRLPTQPPTNLTGGAIGDIGLVKGNVTVIHNTIDKIEFNNVQPTTDSEALVQKALDLLRSKAYGEARALLATLVERVDRSTNGRVSYLMAHAILAGRRPSMLSYREYVDFEHLLEKAVRQGGNGAEIYYLWAWARKDVPTMDAPTNLTFANLLSKAEQAAVQQDRLQELTDLTPLMSAEILKRVWRRMR